MVNPVIIIDPGHGGKDPGAVGNNMLEKFINWQLANDLQYWLSFWKCQTKIIQPSTWMDSTGQDELYLPVSHANKERADFFISLHVNAGGGEGFESFCLSSGSEADRVRNIVHGYCARYMGAFGMADRGQKYKGLYVLEFTRMPAILFECGFIDNSADAKLLSNTVFLRSLSYVVAQGLAEGLGLERR